LKAYVKPEQRFHFCFKQGQLQKKWKSNLVVFFCSGSNREKKESLMLLLELVSVSFWNYISYLIWN